jgi:hypothetical protein
MKRGNKDILNKITEAIEAGLGRIAACKKAGLNYQTFLNWLNSEHPNYDLDFFEAIKKAEAQGLQTIKETCINVILKAATDRDKPVWQAAAWMLERKFKDEFSTKQELSHDVKIDNDIKELMTKYLELKNVK